MARQLYIVDFSPVCLWATESERVDELAYRLLEGDCPEVCEAALLADLGYVEEELPYTILNDRDGTPRDVPAWLQEARWLTAAAPKLLATCKQYANACTTRIEVIQEEEGRHCACEDKTDHDRHCPAGEQIGHWQAVREMVDAVVRDAEGN